MDTYFLSHFIVLGTMVLVSMFFSAVETSLLSFPRLLLQRKAQEPGLMGAAFKEWNDHPNRVLTAILIGNNTVNVAATTLVAYMAIEFADMHHFSRGAAGTVASIAVTFVLVVFGEAIPKITGRSHSAAMATWLIIPIYLFDRLLTPLTWAFGKFVTLFLPRLGQTSLVKVTEEDVKQLIEMGHKAGTIQEEEQKMIHSIFKFSDTQVKEVMIPRTDMFSVDIAMPLERLLDLVVQNGYSRVPVYKGNADNIMGIINTRDLLSIWKNHDLIVLQDLLRKPYFVPESMRVDRLLREFRRGRFHMAIVVDEYGGTAGLVTLEDLVEEIVGEIRDEHETEEDKAINRLDDGSWVIEADVALDEVNETLGLHLTPKGEVASLGGYLMETLGKMPRKGRVVEDREAIFKILEASEKSVVKVKVTKRKIALASVETEGPAPTAPKPRRKKAKTSAPESLVVEVPVTESRSETVESNVENP
jgi:putative hemolysin